MVGQRGFGDMVDFKSRAIFLTRARQAVCDFHADGVTECIADCGQAHLRSGRYRYSSHKINVSIVGYFFQCSKNFEICIAIR